MALLNLKILYAPQKDSPGTYIMGDIGVDDTLVTVGNADIWSEMSLPFPLTLGYDKKVTERIMCTAITGDQLTIERGTGAMVWLANTLIARVFNAQDLLDLQSNVSTIATQVDINTTTIESEVENLNTAIETESQNRSDADDELTTNKIDRTETPTVITSLLGIVTPTPGSDSKLQFSSYDTNTKTASTEDISVPIASPSKDGFISATMWQAIIDLQNAVTALQQQGGLYIGQGFATHAALNAFATPATTNPGDFTFVQDDEDHDDATTRYIYDGTKWDFAYIINYDPVGIATTTTPGLVLAGTDVLGQITVDATGKVTVGGLDNFITDSL